MTEKSAYIQETLANLEAILFAASGPVSFSQLAEVMGLKSSEMRVHCLNLSLDYEKRGAGIRMQLFEDKVQLTTAPETASAVETFLGLEATQKLSRAALETLTIIAYRQPVSRPAIDSVRGVGSDYVVRGLLNRGLIEEVGRAETPGRPILYGTTQDFLLYFGLSSIDDLPPFAPEVVTSEQEDMQVLKE